MRIASIAFTVCLLFAALGAGAAAPKASQVLYYVDDTRNVCRADIDEAGKLVGKTRRLTTSGCYDRASVSQDEKRIVGFSAISRCSDKDTDSIWTSWKVFTEEPTKKGSRQMLAALPPMMDPPRVLWSPKTNYFALSYGPFNVHVDAYEFATKKKVVTDSPTFPMISPDERYVVTGVNHPLGTRTNLLELKTGKTLEVSDSRCSAVWMGETTKFARIDHSGTLFLCEVATGSDLALSYTKNACSASYDLRFIAGKGLYFIDGTYRSGEVACYLADGGTRTQCDRLPDALDRWQAAASVKTTKGAVFQDATYSPDGAFVACPILTPPAKASKIVLFDKSGKVHPLATGTAPLWRGPDTYWDPYQQSWN